ncbi:GntR family transcriptional regulator [Actinoallomurus sp. NBC_01490]|jgi:GntR family transcriptional regulator|uniref:GntR family transcriptional regulator n=1 Tax=Actinoallomurus sp. NBC_01490 TaxID=2903557 RepID=UPI002E31FB13|nr:GntR family transcriptional regulator [Actinoallomurus sp. NBC_01490]
METGPAVSSRPRAERARRAADVLRQQITSQAFEGGRLPDERILAAQLGASRNAIRAALGLLRAEGLITRRRGVGTVVAQQRYGHSLDRLAGLAETLVGRGEITNEVRAAHPVAGVPDAVARRLELPRDAGAVYLERLRRLDGEPLSLDATYLPLDIGRPLLECELTDQDVFVLLERISGQPLGRADLAVHAMTAGADTAALLGIPAGAAVFAIDRLTRLADGRPVDAETVHIRADRLVLQATLHRGAVPSAP